MCVCVCVRVWRGRATSVLLKIFITWRHVSVFHELFFFANNNIVPNCMIHGTPVSDSRTGQRVAYEQPKHVADLPIS